MPLKEHFLEVGKFRINKDFNELFVDGKEVSLSNIEYHILLLLALAAAVLCFLSVHRLGGALVDHYIIQSDYSQRRDARYVEKLQAYIRENNLSTRDKDQLAA